MKNESSPDTLANLATQAREMLKQYPEPAPIAVSSGGPDAVNDEASGDTAATLATPKPVRCRDCLHFQRDTIGDGHGIGRCGIDAPEQRRHPPSKRYPAGHYGTEPALWPNVERTCCEFRGVNHG